MEEQRHQSMTGSCILISPLSSLFLKSGSPALTKQSISQRQYQADAAVRESFLSRELQANLRGVWPATFFQLEHAFCFFFQEVHTVEEKGEELTLLSKLGIMVSVIQEPNLEPDARTVIGLLTPVNFPQPAGQRP